MKWRKRFDPDFAGCNFISGVWRDDIMEGLFRDASQEFSPNRIYRVSYEKDNNEKQNAKK